MREWLILLRQDKGLTQNEVAKESGIKRPYYTMIEQGLRNPSVEVAKKISVVIGCNWTFFFENKGVDMTRAK